MERLKKIIADTVLVVQVLIGFILVFEHAVEVPVLLQAFGRLHPLLLHLPIGLLLVTVLLIFTRKHFEGKSVDQLVSLLLHFTAITASITTLMGLLLSLEGTFGTSQMWLHKWLGIALSFLCWALLIVKDKMKVLKPLGVAGVVMLILTGHYGARLTHGENFVLAPLESEPKRVTRVITDSTALFSATIEPILESKCYGCHNAKKAKGDLILTSLESIRKGGENGAVWEPGSAESSLIVERLLLPMDHDEHMPPKDKVQLTDDEVRFISLWISAGADTEKKIIEVAESDTLAKLAALIIPRYQAAEEVFPTYSFEFALPETIADLNRPNRTVFQIAKNEPAVQADFFLRESFDNKYLEELLGVKNQLISLNLSRMPVNDADLRTVRKFEKLEVLNLNYTDLKGTSLDNLADLPALRSLSLSGTDVNVENLRALGASSSLREVFVWNTPVSQGDVDALKNEFSHIHWDIGFVPDENEILKLNTAMVGNKSAVLDVDEKAIFRHNLPGTEIRYSIDGSDPDSVSSPVFNDPLEIGTYASIKTKAFKSGWLSSDVAEFIFFRKGVRPDSVSLASEPDKMFQGEGALTLVDGLKGLADFYRHPAWIAFKGDDLVLNFSFEEAPTVQNITLSFAHNAYSICLPPDEMEIWGGDDPDDLHLITRKKFAERARPNKARIEGASMNLVPSKYRYYRLVAKPIRKLAEGNPKKRSLWLMVDEVFIN
jgi:uncharacterized membrane protein